MPACGELCSGDFHLVSTTPGSSSTSTRSNVKNAQGHRVLDFRKPHPNPEGEQELAVGRTESKVQL